MSEHKGADRALREARDLAGSFGFEEVDPAEKSSLVAAVFDRVATSYDLMNDLMSGFVHRLWKDALVDWLAPRPGLRLVDLAGGTGDVTFRVWDRLEGDVRIHVVDVNQAMVQIGRDRALDTNRLSGLHWLVGDAMALPLADRSQDALTIAFGIRNVTHIERALEEAFRVLVPGGRFLCLEFSQVELEPLRRLYDAYSFNVVPKLGGLVAGDEQSYRYLVESIRRFPDQKSFARLIGEAGFEQVRYRNLSGGIACIHSGWRL